MMFATLLRVRLVNDGPLTIPLRVDPLPIQ